MFCLFFVQMVPVTSLTWPPSIRRKTQAIWTWTNRVHGSACTSRLSTTLTSGIGVTDSWTTCGAGQKTSQATMTAVLSSITDTKSNGRLFLYILFLLLYVLLLYSLIVYQETAPFLNICIRRYCLVVMETQIYIFTSWYIMYENRWLPWVWSSVHCNLKVLKTFLTTFIFKTMRFIGHTIYLFLWNVWMCFLICLCFLYLCFLKLQCTDLSLGTEWNNLKRDLICKVVSLCKSAQLTVINSRGGKI